MESSGKPITRFILTGPESTGKSVLTMAMAENYSRNFIPEYARDYIINLTRPYNYSDVLHIAEKQVGLMTEYSKKSAGFLFVDTYLIITKIWFLKVFGRFPGWIDNEILKTKNDIYLLCRPDIPWVPDGVRENGGEKRELLFNDYLNELNNAGLHYSFVEGGWDIRLKNAISIVDQFISEKRLG
jgi:nicotinamide riboside kinase